MAIIGDRSVLHPGEVKLMELVGKVRHAGGLRFADEHFTADGIEATVIDPQTGQLALLSLLPINAGQCPGCGHVSHQDMARCAANSAITQIPCDCPGAWREWVSA